MFQLMPLHWGITEPLIQRVLMVGKGSYRGVIDPGGRPCRNNMGVIIIAVMGLLFL